MTKTSNKFKRGLMKGATVALMSSSLLGAFAGTALAQSVATPTPIVATMTSSDRVNVIATFSSIVGDQISPTFNVSEIPYTLALGETSAPLKASVMRLRVTPNSSPLPFSNGTVIFESNSPNLVINADNTITATQAGVYTINLSVKPESDMIQAINDQLKTAGQELVSLTELATNGINSQIQITVTEPTFPVFRVYNPNSGQHVYTSSAYERDHLVNLGWRNEGEGWQSATAENGIPVYRVYNPNAGGHHYTTSLYEAHHLRSIGWNLEGIAFYSSKATDRPVFRVYNPNSTGPTYHHYTESAYERDFLVNLGWINEGIGWYSGIDS